MSSPTALAKTGKKRIGKRDHDLSVVPRRNTPVFPGIEYLSCMAIAVSPFLYEGKGWLMVGE